MAAYRRWIGAGLAVGIIAALMPLMNGSVGELDLKSSLKKLQEPTRETRRLPDLDGLDLTRLKLHPERVTTPLKGGRVAELTLDSEVQRAAQKVMRRYSVPEAGVVLMDVSTGELVAYASQVLNGDSFDVNVRAEAPAASVFKIVTGAALVEQAQLTAKTEQCYHGGRSRIMPDELIDDPKRDKWCTSLAMAMGRSINVVFARLAKKHLTPESLTAVGGALGFGAPVPFAADNEPSTIELPEDPVEFARSAAGFWHTSLSPLAGASLAQTIANKGITLEPRIVSAVLKGNEKVWEEDRDPNVLRRAVKPETAKEVTRMMIQTVASGSAFKAFHDGKRRPFLPGMQIAGKTGTLTRHKANRHYTWFVGFAPAHDPEVAVSALVVNTPIWRIKAHQLAREVLRAYFAKQGRRGVTRP